MNLTVVPVKFMTETYAQVKDLYIRSYKEDVRIPIAILMLLSERKTCDFNAYYDGDTFVGFSHSMNFEHEGYLFYLAVREDLRSHGYGSAILEKIRALYPGKPLCMDIEALDPRADDYEQRLRRLEFFEQNGFHRTHMHIQDGDVIYEVVGSDDFFDVFTYAKDFNKWMFGLFDVKLIEFKA
ncbi:MAG: GNAT family N-acetyltransferase [Eggerthellaceae bacterium]|nr:GNAT family N-acetyltransferase [Eggerthellaceae bacterium]